MTTEQGLDGGSPRIAQLLIVLVLLGVGAVINVGWNILLPGFASGLRGHADASLITLVMTEQPTLREQYGFAANLHDLGRGGSIVVPSGETVSVLLAESLAQMDVVVEQYEVSMSNDTLESLGALRAVEGSGRLTLDGDAVPYLFLMADVDRASTLVYFESGDLFVMIDARLLDR